MSAVLSVILKENKKVKRWVVMMVDEMVQLTASQMVASMAERWVGGKVFLMVEKKVDVMAVT